MSNETTASATRIDQIAIAAVLQNAATGLLFGTFGTALFAIEKLFKADRGQSTLTISLAVVSVSLAAAWLGARIGKHSLKPLMIAGSLLSASGFALLAMAHTVWQLWAIYLLLLGPGAGLAGVLATNTLASAWTTQAGRGKALGWVNAPVLVTLAPLAAAWVLERYGLPTLFLCLAACHLAMLPLLALVDEPPRQPVEAAQVGPAPTASASLLFALVLIIGIIGGGGMLKLAHLIPLVMAQGYSFDRANLLLAISGGTGIAGSLILGWLADRIGAARSLALNAVLQALSWAILLTPVPFWLLVVDGVIVGICGGGLQAVIGTLLGRLYPPQEFARIYGLLSLFTLPFLFGLPWLAGVLFVRSGAYFLPILLQIGLFILAGAGALALSWREQSRPPSHRIEA